MKYDFPVAKKTTIPKPRVGRLNSDKSHWISQKLDQYDQHFVDASQETGVPISWLKTIAMQESTGDANSKNNQDWGLMQIRPVIWKEYGREFNKANRDSDRLQVRANIFTAARYLKDLQQKYPEWSREQLIKAYNTGETVMRKSPELRKAAAKSEYVQGFGKYYKTVDSLENSRRSPTR